MKKNFAIDYCLYSIAKVISWFARIIPLSISISFGRGLGVFAFYFLIKKRRIAYKNIKIAFPQYQCKKINSIVKNTFKNCGQHFAEIFYLPWMDDKYIKKFIEFEGLDSILKLMENKKGSIFLGLHEGSWEVASIVLAQTFRKFKYTILVRTQGGIPLLDKLLNEFRTTRQCGIITIKDDLRLIVEHLKNGFAVGMATDHGGQGGILVNFFERPALTPVGALKLALKLDANLIVGFTKRSGFTRHKISLFPYKLIKSNNVDEDLKINLENIHRLYEEYIKQDPAEYLWFFKRWKYSPQRNVLVLSDGKAGHVKQSLAVLDLIKKLPLQIKSDIVEVKFSNNWKKIAFLICGFFFSKKCQGCLWCFSKLFNSGDVKKITFNCYDAVISCGSSISILNRLIAFENMAKSIVIMKPGMFSLKRFDLAIVPEHDNPPRFRNTVVINGALSIGPEETKEPLTKIVNEHRLNNLPLVHPVIGVLLGGSNKYLSLDKNIVEKLINSINEVMGEIGGSVLVTTSRRTNNDIEQILKQKLSHNSKCRMLIIANEYNPQGSVDAIINLSDILVVSADSISMMSESTNVGKYTIAVKLKRRIPVFSSKYERFADNLKKNGFIYYVSGNNLTHTIVNIWKEKPNIKRINNQEIILNRLKKIL